ncbi:hypothetical protein ACHAXA_001137 [Cyclostephanos tholiformis]|uniref:Uncharacterized protein n=1 Tax=Cyclostephanos tholiformis TaxID=382380 RepID=A0ABD3R4C1_9STRA
MDGRSDIKQSHGGNIPHLHISPDDVKSYYHGMSTHHHPYNGRDVNDIHTNLDPNYHGTRTHHHSNDGRDVDDIRTNLNPDNARAHDARADRYDRADGSRHNYYVRSHDTDSD